MRPLVCATMRKYLALCLLFSVPVYGMLIPKGLELHLDSDVYAHMYTYSLAD